MNSSPPNPSLTFQCKITDASADGFTIKCTPVTGVESNPTEKPAGGKNARLPPIGHLPSGASCYVNGVCGSNKCNPSTHRCY